MEEQRVGKHRVVKRRADLAVMHFGENPTAQEMGELLDKLSAMVGTDPFVLLLDFTQVNKFAPDVRRVIGEKTRNQKSFGIGMYGATFQLRVIAKLINSAIFLFRKVNVPQEFFDDEASAVAWADALCSQRVGRTA